MTKKSTNIDKELLDKLNDAIKYCGLSQTEIATKVGIDQSTLSDYKHYRAMPSLTTFKKICKVIDADANEILNLK